MKTKSSVFHHTIIVCLSKICLSEISGLIIWSSELVTVHVSPTETLALLLSLLGSQTSEVIDALLDSCEDLSSGSTTHVIVIVPPAPGLRSPT